MLNKKMKQTNESGRSMVEMLGVLAVIGVLSVMGIAGYTQAMKSHKANEIVNATSMLYMMGISANGGQGVTEDLTYSAAFGGTLPDGVSTLTYKTDGSIDLTIADETIRSRVANILGSKANSTEGSTTLSITMHTGSSSQGGNSGTTTDPVAQAVATCEAAGKCANGACVNGGNDYPFCADACQDGDCTQSTYRCSSGNCFCTGGYGNCSSLLHCSECFDDEQDCIDAGICTCDASMDCHTDTYMCSSGYCYCYNGASGTYPNCTK